MAGKPGEGGIFFPEGGDGEGHFQVGEGDFSSGGTCFQGLGGRFCRGKEGREYFQGGTFFQGEGGGG